MKLRIQGNLLRFRLTQKEVAQLHEGGRVECTIRFPSGRALSYSVSSWLDTAEASVDYDDDAISVRLPYAVAKSWAQSDQVTIQGSHHSGVEILVEKDFQCLHKPEDRDPDAWPNPLNTDSTV